MATCRYFQTCQLFDSPGQFSSKKLSMKSVKKMFCEENYSKCARYMMKYYSPDISVPDDLLPDQKDRAAELIAAT